MFSYTCYSSRMCYLTHGIVPECVLLKQWLAFIFTTKTIQVTCATNYTRCGMPITVSSCCVLRLFNNECADYSRSVFCRVQTSTAIHLKTNYHMLIISTREPFFRIWLWNITVLVTQVMISRCSSFNLDINHQAVVEILYNLLLYA